MTLARSDVVVDGAESVYHCVSRCVRRAFLCGEDPYTGRSYEHRKEWVLTRLQNLSSVFALEIAAYAVMSNHVHLVLRTRPDWRESWTAEEAARRWLTIFPKKRDESGRPTPPGAAEIRALAGSQAMIAEIYRRLGSVSWFMRCLNEYIARLANREDGCKGRFWEGRFKCQAILDEPAALACLTYVDLNPVRANVVKTPEESRYTSAFERIENRKRLELRPSGRTLAIEPPVGLWLCPIGLEEPDRRGLTSLRLEEYLELLDWTGRQILEDKRGAIPDGFTPILERIRIDERRWVDTVRGFGRMFHGAAGRLDSMMEAARRMGRRWLKGARAGGTAFLPL